MKQFQKAIDKAAKKGIIHKNKAAREKSRIIGFVKRSHQGEVLGTVKASKKTAKVKGRAAMKKKASSRKKK